MCEYNICYQNLYITKHEITLFRATMLHSKYLCLVLFNVCFIHCKLVGVLNLTKQWNYIYISANMLQYMYGRSENSVLIGLLIKYQVHEDISQNHWIYYKEVYIRLVYKYLDNICDINVCYVSLKTNMNVSRSWHHSTWVSLVCHLHSL